MKSYKETHREQLAARSMKAKIKRRGLKIQGSLSATEYRQVVYEAKKCGICGKAYKKSDKRSLDHIIPLTKGGTHDIFNVQSAHMRCNTIKNARIPTNITLPLKVGERAGDL